MTDEGEKLCSEIFQTLRHSHWCSFVARVVGNFEQCVFRKNFRKRFLFFCFTFWQNDVSVKNN